MGSRRGQRWGFFINSKVVKYGWSRWSKVWGGWNGQSHSIGEVVELDWGVYFVDGSIWVVPTDHREVTKISLPQGGVWGVMKKQVTGEGEKNQKGNIQKDQNWGGRIRHDSWLIKSDMGKFLIIDWFSGHISNYCIIKVERKIIGISWVIDVLIAWWRSCRSMIRAGGRVVLRGVFSTDDADEGGTIISKVSSFPAMEASWITLMIPQGSWTWERPGKTFIQGFFWAL